MAQFYLSLNLFLVIMVSFTSSSSVLQWLGWSSNPLPLQVPDAIPIISVPFEELSSEDKFLQEAKKYMKLSGLDICQQKLIMKIQTSCAEITEEGLAKLSVQLLNCQSEAEGRKLYPCTNEMTLKECTSAMDSNTWNAYHLMNNRVRAVCYTSRQQQFRVMSEMTVNKLMATSQKQLQTINQLQEVQKQLVNTATNTLTWMVDGQKELVEQQQLLGVLHENIKYSVIHNVNQLKHERALINASHKKLLMTKELGGTLDSVQRQLQDYSILSDIYYKQVINNIETIAFRAERIWHRIDETARLLSQQQKITLEKHKETLNNLERINVTVSYLLNVLERAKSELDFCLKWITDIVGGTDEQLDKTISLVQHAFYLLLTMIVAVFLQASVLTRLALLCLVSSNIIVMYNFSSSFDTLNFTSLTVVIISVMVGEWMFYFVYHKLVKLYGSADQYMENKAVESPIESPASVNKNNTFSNYTKPFEFCLSRPDYEHLYKEESSDEDEGYSSNKKTTRNSSLHQRNSLNLSTPGRTFSKKKK